MEWLKIASLILKLACGLVLAGAVATAVSLRLILTIPEVSLAVEVPNKVVQQDLD